MATISKYETTSGATLWEVRYRTPDQRSTRKRGFATKRDARGVRGHDGDVEAQGEFVSVSVGRTTVGELGRRGWSASAGT